MHECDKRAQGKHEQFALIVKESEMIAPSPPDPLSSRSPRWHAGAHWNERGERVRCLPPHLIRRNWQTWLKHGSSAADSALRRLGRPNYVPSLPNTWVEGGPGATLTKPKVRCAPRDANRPRKRSSLTWRRSNARISGPPGRLHRCPVTEAVKCHRRISRFWHLRWVIRSQGVVGVALQHRCFGFWRPHLQKLNRLSTFTSMGLVLKFTHR